jgi:hypothetical protein
MVKMRGLVYVLLLALLVPGALALSTIEVEPLHDHILFGEKATFDVTVKNIRDSTQIYDISSTVSGIEWGVQTRPLGDKKFGLSTDEERTVRVTAEPVERFSPGVYIINLVVNSDFGEKYTLPLKVYMGTDERKNYLPSIRASIDMNDRIDPRETQSVKIFIENLNPLDLTGLSVQTTNEVPELNMEQIIDLEPGPGSKKTVEFSYKLSDNQQPKKYFIFFQFSKDDEIIKIVEKRVEVLPLIPEFSRHVDEQISFFKNVREVTFTNDGNVRNTQTATLDVSIIQRLFTSTDPDARSVKNSEGKRAVGWEIELGPGESVVVRASTNYRVPLFVLLIIIIAFILYYYYKNPIGLSKTASNVLLHEGGMSGLKVTLVVKNLSANVLRDIEIRDQIPGIADMEKHVEMGTMKHTQILRGKRGTTFVKWKLSELEGKEERLITYKLRSKLNVVGAFQLPRAKATYISEKGKKRSSFSNSFRVSTGE